MPAKHLDLILALTASLLLVAGCGGGGASPSATAASTAPGAVAAPTIAVALSDPTSGAARTSITLGSPALANATVLDAKGKAVPNTLVTFSTNPTGQASITPASGTALTNASGVATVQLDPASLTAAGAVTLSAAATVAGNAISASVSFSIGAANLGLSGLSAGGTALSAYGTRSVTVNITGVPATTAVAVNFSSLCAAAGKASLLPASAQSINGSARATYTDAGCGTTDTISANIAGTTVTATTALAVTAPDVASVQFVSATPTTIVQQGTGGTGLSQSSIVVFKVVDNFNKPINQASVAFAATPTDVGIVLGQASGLTGPDGTVSVSVTSGTVPTPVWVTASIGKLNSQSPPLRVATGLPSQDNFSLSVSTLNIEGWQYDGVTTTVTARASERLSNPVPDGTAISFVAEGAQIQPSCTTTDGACSVTLTSSEYRPTGDSEPTGRVAAGRVTVLAYALGEESFTDLNKNNRYDPGEPFNDLGLAFIDKNENGVFDGVDQTIAFGSGSSPCVVGIPNSAAAPSKAGTCDGVWGAAHVRRDVVVTLSGSVAHISTQTLAMGGACAKSFVVGLYDLNNNPMPAQTTAAASNLTTALKTASVVGGSPVPSTSAAGGTFLTLRVEMQLPGGGDCIAPNLASGSFTLKISTPKNVTSAFDMNVTP